MSISRESRDFWATTARIAGHSTLVSTAWVRADRRSAHLDRIA